MDTDNSSNNSCTKRTDNLIWRKHIIVIGRYDGLLSAAKNNSKII